MENQTKDSLAALAVFRELYDTERGDIRSIIGKFIITLFPKFKNGADEETIITSLNDTYGFEIPQAVVTSLLKKLVKNGTLKKENSHYSLVKELDETSNDVVKNDKKIKASHQEVYDELIQFLEEKDEKTSPLSPSKKENIVGAFRDFLMDKKSNSGEYTAIFHDFVLNHIDLKDRLNTVKEGVILMRGLQYHSDIESGMSTWKTPLTIFLDMEILFHAAGYNGGSDKTFFSDFLKLVQEVNNHKKNYKKRIIHLKYFSKTKQDVDNFFTTAKSIVKGTISPDPSKTAMTEIVTGCEKTSDVLSKKTNFYSKVLKGFGILEAEDDGYAQDEESKYGLENAETLNLIKKEGGYDTSKKEKQREYSLKHLSSINILRKGRTSDKLQDAHYLFVSGTGTTLSGAFDIAKDSKKIPLALHLNSVTERLWFLLNKGFGNGKDT